MTDIKTFEEFEKASKNLFALYKEASRKVAIQECLKIAADLANEEPSCSERRAAAWRIVSALQHLKNTGPSSNG